MGTLVTKSIEVILQNQDDSGAYIASPDFRVYKYCWLRDGAFIAYAMDVIGRHESSSLFHDWVANIVNSRGELIKQTISKSRKGVTLSREDFLHTRYELNGTEGKEEWPNYQLDGFGTWLWSLERYQNLTNSKLPEEWVRAAVLVSEYLKALWDKPCYDCWEEFPNKIHTYTLGAIYAGLRATSGLIGSDDTNSIQKISSCIYENALHHGHFTKYIGADIVDASLIGLSVPYGFVKPTNPIMQRTVKEIEGKLIEGGGLRRNQHDTYYGGGEWILLTAWLGWYYTTIGKRERAEMALRWVEKQADHANNLPEQVSESLNAPFYYEYWVNLLGESARTLLWSHANYLILHAALRRSAH